jgi:hypothetical protein
MTQDNLLDPPERDAINPAHYKSHPSGIECIEISKHLSGCLAQAFQYVWRCGQKDDPIQELNKAIWFLRQELDIKSPMPMSSQAKECLNKVSIAAKYSDPLRASILINIANANAKISKCCLLRFFDNKGFASNRKYRDNCILNAIAEIEQLKASYAKT